MSNKKTARSIVTIVVIGIALFAISSVLKKNKAENEEKTAIVAQTNSEVLVKAAMVENKPFNLDFSSNGNFIPFQQINFSAETSGRVTSVLVKEGDKVSKGQTLAVIKTANLNIDLETAKEVYNNALQEKNRFESAFKTGGVTQQQVDQAELNLKNAAFRVEQAAVKITDANIRASINGIVNKRFIEPGSVLSPGTQLFEIVDVSKLKLQVQVNEAQVALLKVGDKAVVKVSVFPDKTFEGKIRFIAPKADDALNYPVEVEMNNQAATQVKAGMFATALFQFQKTENSLVVPRTAFVGSVNSNQVFVINPDNSVSLKTIRAGRINGEEVEVLEGLKEADKVVTSGQFNLSEGSIVAITQ